MKDDVKSDERRECQRTRLKRHIFDAVKMQLLVNGQPHPLTRVVDVTPGGMGIESPTPLQSGMAVEIIASIGLLLQTIVGKTGWCRPTGQADTEMYRIGIIFDKRHLTKNLNFFVTLGKINIDSKLMAVLDR